MWRNQEPSGLGGGDVQRGGRGGKQHGRASSRDGVSTRYSSAPPEFGPKTAENGTQAEQHVCVQSSSAHGRPVYPGRGIRFSHENG